MRNSAKKLVLNLLIILTTIGLIGCSNTNIADLEFGLEEFENEMKSKGYEYKRQDIEEGLLTPISQYMIMDNNEDIVVYSYKDNNEMEKEAKTINNEASEITKEDDTIGVEWPSKPHFYKKGKIIVRYVGEDEKIISDLKEIMGEQFAGIE